MESRLTIENFKCFSKQNIEFRDLTVLAGANSVGKSTVVQALLLARTCLNIKNRKVPASINLNDIYNLNLGNTQEVLNRDANEDLIKFSFQGFPSLSETDAIQLTLDVPKELDKYNLVLTKIVAPTYGDEDDVKVTFFSQNKPSLLYYLNAERFGPRLNHQVGSLDYLHAGYAGEYTIQILEKVKDEKIDISKAFDTEENLRFHRQVQLWMNYIVPGVDVNVPKLYEKVRTAEMAFGQSSPTNVGFGVSYVLPIILNGLLAQKDSMFIVENPEAHLHPSGQSRIGYFLAKMAASGVQVIIETHSEHMINGIRIASINDVISNNQILINFFSKKETHTQPIVETIEINQMGDLTKFPYGFFDQAIHDTTAIIKTRRTKKNSSL
jgi:predicted ATPase